MPVSRMRMRPWLEKMIESKTITGLTWVDKDKTMFSIPWKHAARHGWEMDKDACLFKMWAIHTGKYVEGQTTDPKTWKANFRCAMNSLPDIEEVKDRSINKGHQAVRVFRMLPATPKSRDKRSKAKETKHRKKSSDIKMEDEDSDESQSYVSQRTSSTQENTVDSTVHTEEQDRASASPYEAPDYSHSVEIESDPFSSSFTHKFEVSPDHDMNYDITDDIIEICQQLERDSHWSYDSRGFLDNEVCTSPGSHWSESSSADELEEIPQYTTLNSTLTNSADDFWSNFCHQIPPLI